MSHYTVYISVIKICGNCGHAIKVFQKRYTIESYESNNFGSKIFSRHYWLPIEYLDNSLNNVCYFFTIIMILLFVYCTCNFCVIVHTTYTVHTTYIDIASIEFFLTDILFQVQIFPLIAVYSYCFIY